MIAAAAGNIARLLPHRRDYVDLSRSWRRDILAGITVGVVALPLALAFGILIVLLVAIGSLWIMSDLNDGMLPSESMDLHRQH